MKRGEVWWIRFDPASIGGEIRKTRLAVIVSVNASNRALNRLLERAIRVQLGL